MWLDEIKSSFDFDNLLLRDGYHFDPVNSSKDTNFPDGFKYKIFHLLGDNNRASITLMRGYGPTGHKIYNNRNDSSDKGSVLDYLLNHRGYTMSEAISFLKVYLPEEKDYSKQVYTSKTHLTAPEPFEVLGSTNIYFDIHLKGRGLYKALKFQEFDGYAKLVHYRKGEKKAKTLGFPIFDKDQRIVAFSLRNDFAKGILTGERFEGLWHSKIIEGATLFFGESALDCMAYAILNHRAAPLIYVSSEGNYSAKYASTIQKWFPDIAERNKIFGFDNDLPGVRYSLMFIRDFNQLPYNVGLHKGQTKIEDRLHITFNDLHDLRLYKGLGEVVDSQKKLIVDVKQGQELVKRFTDYYCVKNLELKVPNNKDWNDDLLAVKDKRRRLEI